MLPRERSRPHPNVAFDDQRLVANAGLLLPITLAHHLGLGELVDRHVDLGDAPGRANAGDKVLTLVARGAGQWSRLWRTLTTPTRCVLARPSGLLGCVVKAPSTLGTFLRSFRWGHVRQLDRVSREALAQAWAFGAGPGDDPLTIDLDSIRRRRTRPTGWRRRAHANTATPASGAITRSSPWPRVPARC